jgi:endonuclease/exonuclease/phosphatase family metal-dependent hydrolase
MKKVLMTWIISASNILVMLGQQSGISVMTYNIWYANPDAGENIWENRREGVVQAILDQKTDIAGLQEVLYDQLTYLEEKLPDYAWVGAARDDGKQKGEFAPVFFRKQRFELLGSRNFWLSETPDSAGTLGWDAACVRIVTWAKFRERNSSSEFVVFNTHFDHEGDTARLNSAMLLKEKIAAIAGDQPVIVTGDFNCKRDSEPYIVLTGESGKIKLNDSRYASAFRTLRPDYSYIGSEFKGVPGEIIDHIFVSQAFGIISSKILENCNYRRCPSDHLPVITIVKL